MLSIISKGMRLAAIILFAQSVQAQGYDSIVLFGNAIVSNYMYTSGLSTVGSDKLLSLNEGYTINNNNIFPSYAVATLFASTGSVIKALKFDTIIGNSAYYNRVFRAIMSQDKIIIQYKSVADGYYRLLVTDTMLNVKFVKKIPVEYNGYYGDNKVMLINNNKLYSAIPITDNNIHILLYKIDLSTGNIDWCKKININDTPQAISLTMIQNNVYLSFANITGNQNLHLLKMDTQGFFIKSIKINYPTGLNSFVNSMKLNGRIDYLINGNLHLLVDTSLNIVRSEKTSISFLYRASRNENNQLLSVLDTLPNHTVIINIDSNFNIIWSKKIQTGVSFLHLFCADKNNYYARAVNRLWRTSAIYVGLRMQKIDSLGNNGCLNTSIQQHISFTPVVISTTPLFFNYVDTNLISDDTVQFTELKTIAFSSCDTIPNFAPFTMSRDSICLGDTIALHGLYSDSLVNHTWHIGTDTFYGQNIIASIKQSGWIPIVHITQIDNKIDTIIQRVFVYQSPVFSLQSTPLSICQNGDSTNISANNQQLHYHWNTGDTTRAIVAHSIGIYTVTATDSLGCHATDSIQINNNFCPPTAAIFSVPDTLCIDRSYTFSDSSTANATAWFWTFTNASILNFSGKNLPAITFNNAGTFSLQLIASNAYGSDTFQKVFQLKICDTIKANFTTTTHRICVADCVQFVDSSQFATDYFWTFSGGNPNSYIGQTPPAVCYSAAGDYTVKLVVKNRFAADSITKTNFIKVVPNPILQNVPTEITVEYGDSAKLIACATADKYEWQPTANCTNCSQIMVYPDQPIVQYRCIVSTLEGCADTCFYTINVNGVLGSIYIPNAFSPNADGHNDVFEIYTNNSKIYSTKIFNRWGELLFSSTDLQPKWDGTFKGVPQPNGVYVYEIVHLPIEATETKIIKGSVVLVR